MTPDTLIAIAGLVVQGVLFIFLLGGSKAKADHTDQDLAGQLRRECEDRERVCQELRQLYLQLAKQLAEENKYLREKMQVYEIQLAVMRTQLKLPDWKP